MQDRAKTTRVTRNAFAVLVDLSNGEKDQYEFCKDISEGGLFIETMLPLPIGTVVNLKFRFPHDLSEFRTMAVVRWIRVEDSNEPSGMGLSFIDQSAREREELALKLRAYGR